MSQPECVDAPKRALVLGDGGFLGRHLAAAIDGDPNSGMMRIRWEQIYRRGASAPVATDKQAEWDATAPHAFNEVDWRTVDVVFVLFGATGTSVSFKQGRRFLDINTTALQALLQSIVDQGTHRPRVVYPSTRLVYAGSDSPLAEDALTDARTVYAASKLAGEALLLAYAAAHDVPYCVARIGVPYGNSIDGELSYGTIGALVKAARSSGAIRLFGDGLQRRTFSHVDDLTRCLMLCGRHLALANTTVNLPGEDLSLHHVGSALAGKLGALVEFAPWPEFELKIESGSTVFNAERFGSLTGYTCRQQFERWLAQSTP